LYYNSINKKHLENEKIQSYIRILIILLAAANIVYLQYFSNDISVQNVVQTLFIYPFLVLAISLIHLFFIQKYPALYQRQRIIVMSVVDVSSTVFVMYLAGGLATYYPALFLWFVAGYGMRYGLEIGYIVYVNVIIGWSLLLYFNDFWYQNLDMGLGWLIAYIIIPLYFFKLVKELQNNISQLHKEVDDSNFKALHDPLTKLPNRIYFNKTLEVYMKNYDNKHHKFALIFIDLDEFKMINDTFGHEVGDHVLIEVSKRICSLDGFITRLGGDEFVALVEYNFKDELNTKLINLMNTIRKKCSNPNIHISISIGIALYPDDATTMYELKKKADTAMYKAKEKGKNRYVYFSDTLLSA